MYGKEYVLPYFECHSLAEMKTALRTLKDRGASTGIRTDVGRDPSPRLSGVMMPFVQFAGEADAERLWAEYGSRLVYIVYESFPDTMTWCNVAALRMHETAFLVEYDEGGCSQRAWEHKAIPLSHAYVDRWGGWWQPFNGGVRVVPPKALPERTAIEKMYSLLLTAVEPLVVWTVRTDGRVVLW